MKIVRLFMLMLLASCCSAQTHFNLLVTVVVNGKPTKLTCTVVSVDGCNDDDPSHRVVVKSPNDVVVFEIENHSKYNALTPFITVEMNTKGELSHLEVRFHKTPAIPSKKARTIA